MTFVLSQRSLSKMNGINNELHTVVCSAIKLSKIDFGVICGMRTETEQRALLEKGATTTMKSKHLTGDAVDLMAYINGRASWELNLYDEIANAFKEASIKEGVPIKWGGAWSVPDLRDWEGTSEEARESYIDLRKSQKRSYFLDCQHFQVAT